MNVLKSKFAPGEMVSVDDIYMRVITVEFSWGMAFARYHCEWFTGGCLESKWFHEPDLKKRKKEG